MESSSQVRLWDLYEKARPLGLAWSFVYAAVLVLTGGVSSFLPGFAGVKPSGPQPLSWFPGQRPHLGVLCHLSFSLSFCVSLHTTFLFSPYPSHMLLSSLSSACFYLALLMSYMSIYVSFSFFSYTLQHFYSLITLLHVNTGCIILYFRYYTASIPYNEHLMSCVMEYSPI